MRLREERLRQGLTQLDLAKKTGIHPNEISRIERGVIRPFPGWLKRLAEALNVPEGELFPEAASQAG